MIVYSSAPASSSAAIVLTIFEFFLADRDVDGVNGTEFRIAARQADFVDFRLIDNRIDRDRGLARTAVTDDQFALSTTNRNHRINRHDAGEKRLRNGLPHNDSGRDFLDSI